MFLRRLNLRITALFSALFIGGSLILFAVTYLLLYSSIRRDEFGEIQSRLLEFWAIYQTGSLELLRSEVSVERFLSDERLYMVRIAGRSNNTLFLYMPPRWRGFSVQALERHQVRDGELFSIPSAVNPYRLQVGSLRLGDGNTLQIGITDQRRREVLLRFRSTILLVAIPLFGLSFLGGLLFSTRALRPVHRLIAVTRNIIGTGKLDARIPVTGSGDELDELVSLFNHMLSRIDSLVTGMRESLDNVAHDLRTPMTRLRGIAELALREPARPEGGRREREALAGCINESERILMMLSTLMDISEAESGVMRLESAPIDLSEVVRDMADLYSYSAEEKGVELSAAVPDRLVGSVDLNRMRQVIANLIDNAVKYTPPGGRVEICGRQEGGECVIEVADTGIGIAEEDLSRIWDRLYRSDSSRSQPGLGLGLGLVRAIVKAHGGVCQVSSRPGAGSVFTVRLPL